MAYAVLGPSGTFTEEAAWLYWGKNAELLVVDSIPCLFEMVESGRAEGGLVPLENNLAGTIQPTLECLQKRAVFINGEISMTIHQHLMTRHSYRLEDIELLISHPTALLQCEGFIRSHLAGARTEICNSTARAAQMLVAEERRAAAIGNQHSAHLYGLKIISRDIADHSNLTRFIHISRQSGQQGGEKASLVFTLFDRPGALYQVLGIFARQNLNLCKIESRPNRDSSLFSFYVEVEMDSDQELNPLLEELRQSCQECKYLGSFNQLKGVSPIDFPAP